jgi:glycosyltransferase involved in cell wall biosynthesis
VRDEPGSGLLRVSLDGTAVPPQPGGAGRYTLALAQALAERDDVALTVWCRRGDQGRWSALVGSGGRGGQVRSAAPESRPARLAWEQLGLPRELGALGPAVHHGPHYTLPLRCPVPSVVTVHDLTFVDHPEWHEPAKVAWFRAAIALARRRATVVVCPSRATARRLEATGPVAGPVLVVPHGVDHQRFRPEPPEPGADRAALDALGVAPPYLLYLGTIEPRKAVDVLVAAFGALAEELDPELRLVLAGRDGWGTERVEAALAASPVRHRIQRLGYVPEAAVPALLRQAVAVCYPAVEEGFGLPALEACACGTPVVTTAGSVMEELVGEACFAAPPGDPGGLAATLRRALTDEAERAWRVARGLEVARERTWAASAAGHLEAYRLAVGRGRQRAAGKVPACGPW